MDIPLTRYANYDNDDVDDDDGDDGYKCVNQSLARSPCLKIARAHK